jgi:hypothetical protein
VHIVLWGSVHSSNRQSFGFQSCLQGQYRPGDPGARMLINRQYLGSVSASRRGGAMFKVDDRARKGWISLGVIGAIGAAVMAMTTDAHFDTRRDARDAMHTSARADGPWVHTRSGQPAGLRLPDLRSMPPSRQRDRRHLPTQSRHAPHHRRWALPDVPLDLSRSSGSATVTRVSGAASSPSRAAIETASATD